MSNEDKDLDLFRDRVKGILADQDLTQKAFEQQHDLSRGLLTRLFGGRKKMDLETLEEVAAGLGVPAITLVEGTGFAEIVGEAPEEEAQPEEEVQAEEEAQPEEQARPEEAPTPAEEQVTETDEVPETEEIPAADEEVADTEEQPAPSPDDEPTEQIHRKLPLEGVPFVGLVVRGLANLLGRR